jgi:hypothetical protein
MKMVSKLLVVTSLVIVPALVLACGVEKEKTAEAAPAKPAVAKVEKGEKAAKASTTETKVVQASVKAPAQATQN